MKITHERVECPYCRGTGMHVRPKPASLRTARQIAGVTLRGMAKKLGFSAPYISDVERGHRACTPEILTAYQNL